MLVQQNIPVFLVLLGPALGQYQGGFHGHHLAARDLLPRRHGPGYLGIPADFPRYVARDEYNTLEAREAWVGAVLKGLEVADGLFGDSDSGGGSQPASPPPPPPPPSAPPSPPPAPPRAKPASKPASKPSRPAGKSGGSRGRKQRRDMEDLAVMYMTDLLMHQYGRSVGEDDE